MKVRIAALALIFGAAACATAPTAVEPSDNPRIITTTLSDTIVEAYQLLGRLYGRSDFAGIAKYSEELLVLHPRDPLLTYSIALNYARSGQKEKALEWLEKLAELRSDLIPNDQEFAAIESPEYRAAKAKVVAAAPTVSPARVALRLEDRELIPEGIAYDPVGDRFYIGSLHERKIIAVDRNGNATDFSSPSDGLFSVLGLRVDPERRLLWAATAAHEGFEVNDIGRAAVLKYDLKDGRLLEKYSLGNNPPHLLNDIALGWDGEIYVTDSNTGSVWTIGANDRLTEILKPGVFIYPNGIAASSEKGRLFVADFAQGLSSVDVSTGKAKRLLHPAGANYHGIDGLYYRDGSLLAVQNGAGLGRIIKLRLNEKEDTVTSIEVLHANDPLFDMPTTAAAVGDVLYVIANSQLRRIAPDGRLLNPETLQQPAIIEIPLERTGR